MSTTTHPGRQATTNVARLEAPQNKGGKPSKYIRTHPRDVDTQAGHRWSELVPPRTALTFAAMWDPEDGMVTFSGAHLLDSEALEKTQLKPARDDSPRDVAFADDQSQVLTIDPFALAVTAPDSSPSSPDSFYSSLEAALPSAGVDSFAFAQHAMMMADEDGPVPTIAADSRSCLRVPPGITTVPDSPAAASSMALASLMNVPFKKTMMQSAIGHLPRIRPGLRVETDEQGSRPGTPNGPERAECESVTDEGFFEDHRLTPGLLAPVEMNLSSAFSVTTTSTSRYVEVDMPWQTAPRRSLPKLVNPSDACSTTSSTAWSTLRDAERDICFNVPLAIGRRLRKPRSPRTPTPPPRVPPISAPHALPRGLSPTCHSPLTPADPREVLARAHYNHTPVPGSRAGSVPPPTAFPSSPSPTLVESPRSGHSSSDRGSVHGSAGTGSKLPRKKSLLHRVVPCHRGRSEGSDDRWVYVDIEHKVTQRVCTVSPCR